MVYSINVEAVKDAIVVTLKEVTDFSNQCYHGFYHLFGEEEYPNCLLNLDREELREITKDQDVHNIYFTILIQIKGTGAPETDHDSLVSIVGKVIDKFQADITIDGSCSWSKPLSVDFAWNRGESLVFYVAAITLLCSKSW